MSTQELDRSMLDGKDREELHAIAGAMGVKAPTRMRKSELIDAILDAAEGGPSGGSDDGDGADAPRRTLRSARASELAADTVAALVAEEEALPAVDSTDPGTARPATPDPGETATPDAAARDGAAAAGSPAPARGQQENDDERASYGDGNTRRRRRRRGRGGPDGDREPRVDAAGEPVECHGLL